MHTAPTTPRWQRLRELLAVPTVLHAPGCTDAVTARLVEQASFQVAYVSGAVVSATRLGLPDLGFVGAEDIVAHARLVVGATSLPVVADADTGYGNAVHVARTVALYRDAGIAALHLEDQVSPKRCGHMRGKQVIEADEAVRKVEAAVDASAGTIVVIARTDARSVDGFDVAIDRAGRYHEAGADLVFVEGVSTPDDLATVHAALPAAPLVLNRSEAGGDLTPIADADLHDLGVRLVIHPVSALLAAAEAARRTYADITERGAASTPRMPWDDLNALLGLEAIEAAERTYT